MEDLKLALDQIFATFSDAYILIKHNDLEAYKKWQKYCKDNLLSLLKEKNFSPYEKELFLDKFYSFTLKCFPQAFSISIIIFTVFLYTDYLELCNKLIETLPIKDVSTLCLEFTKHFASLETLFNTQDVNTQRVSRARLLGLINSFEEKLDFTENQIVLAELRFLCYALIPMSFQGVCNRGIRGAPGRHFTFTCHHSTEKGDFSFSDSEDTTMQVFDKTAGEASDSSLESHDQSKSSRKTNCLHKKFEVSSTKAATKLFHHYWEFATQFLQDTVLSKSSVGEIVDLLSALKALILYFCKNPVSNTTTYSFEAKPIQNYEFSIVRKQEMTMEAEAVPERPFTELTENFINLYNIRPSLIDAHRLINEESLRRDLSFRILNMLRCLYYKRVTSNPGVSNVLDSLSPLITSSLESLHRVVRRYHEQLSSCILPIPSVGIYGTPWYAKPAEWDVPVSLSTITFEIDSQESLMAHWKWEGCGEPKECTWTKPKSSLTLKNTQPLKTKLHVSTLANIMIHEQDIKSSKNVDEFQRDQKGYANMQKNFLPIVKAFTEGIEIFNDLCPPTFTRERQDWYMPEMKDNKNENVFKKLKDKWTDYKQKVVSDEDEANQIEESEKSVKDCLFQWRCHRLLNLTNLQLYDYTNQDKDLRIRIREASLKDLIQSVIQKETATV